MPIYYPPCVISTYVVVG